jgi:hypothetical protein
MRLDRREAVFEDGLGLWMCAIFAGIVGGCLWVWWWKAEFVWVVVILVVGLGLSCLLLVGEVHHRRWMEVAREKEITDLCDVA